jgi:microcystin-dependent protein
MFGGNYAPRFFAFCNGQTLAIAQNQALFALLGTTYGGNGVSTFNLPNLQSQLSIHQGQGTGLSNYALGQNGGDYTVTLTSQQMPNHSHPLNATTANATAIQIAGNLLPGQPTTGSRPEFYAAPVQGKPSLIPHTMASNVCGLTGGNQPHTNMMPSLCVSFVIALQGIFPSRN